MFLMVQFNKFFLGNSSDQCRHDYIDVNGQRSAVSALFRHTIKSLKFWRLQDLDMTVVTFTGQVSKDSDQTRQDQQTDITTGTWGHQNGTQIFKSQVGLKFGPMSRPVSRDQVPTFLRFRSKQDQKSNSERPSQNKLNTSKSPLKANESQVKTDKS